jgi:DNA ligase D-like protein (predicted 3'-phosphoesterase)
MWKEVPAEYDTSKTTPEEALQKATTNPADFLGRREWCDKFPQFVDFAVGKLARIEPTAYFMANYYKDPKYSKYNQTAILRLISDRPEMYFNKGLHKEKEFEHHSKAAAYATAQQHPKFFLDTILRVLPEFEEFRGIAVEALKHVKISKRQLIPGGLGKNLKPEDVDQEQLKMGIEVELEHTSNKDLAQEISLDHLAEDPKYYTKLKAVEASMSKRAELWGYWLSPDGKLYEVERMDHAGFVRHHPELFGEQKIEWPYLVAFGQGWVRIVVGSDYLGFEVPQKSTKFLRMIQDVLPKLPRKTTIAVDIASSSTSPRPQKLDPFTLSDFLSADSFADLDKVVSVGKYASSSLTKAELERIYELEYKLQALKDSPRQHQREAMVDELAELLHKGIVAFRQAFDQWLFEYDQQFRKDINESIREYKELPEYQSWPDELLRDHLREKHYSNQVYRNIKHVAQHLQKGAVGNIGTDMALFQEALTTMHHNGSMIQYIPGYQKSGIDLKLLTDLTNDPKYVDKWDKELGKVLVAHDNQEYSLSKRAMMVEAKKHMSVGVFAVLPDSLAKQFPSLGEHDDSKPHITIAFIGEVPKRQYDLLINTVKGVLYDHGPFEVTIDERPSYFAATKHSDDCKVAKMGVSGKDLHKLHHKLIDALKMAGIEMDNHFPEYKPHVTLSYLPRGQEKYEGKVPHGSWTVKEVEIWGCGRKCTLSCHKPISKRAGLKEYQSKRDFTETAEPKGEETAGPNKHRFVIQEHDADKAGLHFDLRLQNDQGTLSSWALPKHRLPNKGERLLAKQTEEHPIDYAKFHDTISKGEYGAGKVKIVSKSETYKPIEWTKSTIKFEIPEGKFTLRRMSGKSWIIMRSKED